jgi:hypothetical protein
LTFVVPFLADGTSAKIEHRAPEHLALKDTNNRIDTMDFILLSQELRKEQEGVISACLLNTEKARESLDNFCEKDWKSQVEMGGRHCAACRPPPTTAE